MTPFENYTEFEDYTKTKIKKPFVNGCGCFILVMCASAVVMAFLTTWTQGNLEWLLGLISNKAVHIHYVLVLILNILCNFFALLFNIICEILKCAF